MIKVFSLMLTAAIGVGVAACGGNTTVPAVPAATSVSSIATLAQATAPATNEMPTAPSVQLETPTAPATTLSPTATSLKTETTAPALTATVLPTLHPNPLSVTAKLDGERASGAVIPVEGGAITATTASGTRFILTLPKDALLSDEKISIVPVTSIDGLPLSGGLSAAVQLEPEGLRPMKPVTLTVEFQSPIDPEKLFGFNYLGSGAEFHLYPSALKGSTLTIPLMHFSGYGAGQGNPSDNQNNTPTSAESQAEQSLAEIFKAQNSELYQTGGYTLDQLKGVADLLDQWYTTSLAPNAKGAETDEGRLEAAAAEYVAWAKWIEILVPSENYQRLLRPEVKEIFAQVQREQAAILESLAKGFKNAIDKAYRRCVDNNKPLEARTMLKWARMGTLLGALTNADIDATQTKVQKCLTFEIDFQSEVSGTTALGGNVQTKVHSRFKFTWENNEVAPLAEGRLEYETVSISPNPPNRDCSAFTFSPRGSLFQILFLRIKWDLNVLKNPGQDTRIEMPIDPGRPSENASSTCKGITVNNLMGSGVWRPGFMGFHSDELFKIGSGFLIKDWVVLGGEIFATKAYQRSKTLSQGLANETTTIDLIHAPEK